MDRLRRPRLFLQFLQRFGSCAIQFRHRSSRRLYVIRCSSILLQRGREYARSDRFRQQKDIARARADIPPNSLRVDDAGNCVPKLNIVVSNRMAADDAAFCFRHFRKATANDLLENVRCTFVRKANDRKRGNRFSAHGIHVTQRIRRRNLSECKWIIDNRREEIDGLNHRHFRAQQIHPGVVVGVKTNQRNPATLDSASPLNPLP